MALKTPSAQFLDLSTFYAGFSILYPLAEDPNIKRHLQTGMTRIVYRTLDDFQGLMESEIGPVVEEKAKILRPAYIKTQRRQSKSKTANTVGDFCYQLFAWLKTRTPVRKSVFSDPKEDRVARMLAQASSEEDPALVLHSLAQINPISGFRAGRKWLRDAAKLMGNPLHAVEEALDDAEDLSDQVEALEEVKEALINAEPGTEDHAVLVARKEDALSQIQETALEQAQGDEESAKALIQAAAKPRKKGAQRTETGKRLGMSPEQEEAMIQDGPKLIAAGAGSGKTRVLSGEIRYRMIEQGVPADQIMACSFTGKASGELIERALKYGAVLEGDALNNFGTTHRIAGVRILNRYGKFKRKYLGKNQQWGVTALISLAMQQVTMKSRRGGPKFAPRPADLFLETEVPIPDAVRNTPFPSFEVDLGDEVKEIIDGIEGAINHFKSMRSSWAYRNIDFLTRMKDRAEKGSDLSNLTFGQKKYINDLLAKSRQSVRIAKEEGEIKNQGLFKYVYWNQPAEQWFNLGAAWEAGSAKGEKAAQMSAGKVRRAIDKWKGKGASPSEAWWAAGQCEGQEPFSLEAAAYAAYEWLKGPNGEPDFAGRGDFADILIDATKTLMYDKKARADLQRVKYIYVDEAQDLSRVQHLMMDLVAGARDHETLEEKDSMTANTYAMIGDDFQSIYAFRGAVPDEMIQKSDLRGGRFKTKLITTNYRSGKEIVEAANRLIAHNLNQVPKVCQAHRDGGAIKGLSFESEESGVDYVARDIEDSAALMGDTEDKWKSFGILTRSNAEAAQYALALLKKGIPFTAKVSPFKGIPVKAMLGWLSIVDQGEGGDPNILKEALINASRIPKSGLGPKFWSEIENSRDPMGWLLGGGATSLYARSNQTRKLEQFIDNVRYALSMNGSPDGPDAVFSNLKIGLKGYDGKGPIEAIVDRIMKDNGIMAELAAESSDGIPEESRILEAAEEELSIFEGLLGVSDTTSGVMNFVRKVVESNEKKTEDRNAVMIGTIHSWKGLEASKIYFPIVRGKFPRSKLTWNTQTQRLECVGVEEEQLEEDRRLAYVAITRAENECVVLDIQHPKADCPPSQFISEACIPMGDIGKAASELRNPYEEEE